MIRDKKRIAIYFKGGIGNFVQLIPSLVKLSKTHKLHVIVPRSLEFAVNNLDLSTEFRASIYKPKRFFGEIIYFAKLFLRERPTAIYLPLDSSRVQLSIRLATFGLIPIFGHSTNEYFLNRFGFLYRVKIYPDLSKKEIDVYSSFFNLENVPTEKKDLKKLILPASYSGIHGYILFQPFVGEAQKWKEFDWKRILNSIEYPVEKIILIGSKEDKAAYLNATVEDAQIPVVNFVVAKSLSELISIANNAFLCISNDSLLMQVCALLDKSCIVYCGPSDFSRSIPNSPFLKLRRAYCPCISKEGLKFFDAIPEIVTCNSRCIKHYLYPPIRIDRAIKNKGIENEL